MSFRTNLLDDAKNVFLNTAELAEEITYVPEEGSARHIKAIVIRERPDTALQDSGRSLQTQAELYVLKDRDLGITRVNKGEDKVIFPPDVEGESIEWRIVDIISKDDALWHLLAQR